MEAERIGLFPLYSAFLDDVAGSYLDVFSRILWRSSPDTFRSCSTRHELRDWIEEERRGDQEQVEDLESLLIVGGKVEERRYYEKRYR